MNNHQIAKLLKAVSAAYQVKGENQFKVIAYDRAAIAVEHATSEVKDLWDDDRLDEISGVGTNIAGHLDELFRTGQVRHFQRVFKGLPPAMFEFIDIPGIGAKTAYKLCHELNIHQAKGALAKLKLAATAGKIRKIEGFGEQSEKIMLENITKAIRPKKERRMLLPFAWQLSEKIIGYLNEDKLANRIDPLGSLRRRCSTVGDLDLAAATKQPKKIIDKFIHYTSTEKVVVAGENTARIILDSGHQVDLKTQETKSYGALLQHYTGSKQHNIHLREIAQKKGLSLSEYGIKNKSGTITAFASEEQFYQTLGMDFIPPELREDNGEIEAAINHQLPKLVLEKEILGDLHTHSDFPIEPSHDNGAYPMSAMVKRAKDLGYQYLGFSEHNPSLSKHTDNQIIEIVRRKRLAVDKINRSERRDFQVFNGLEVDIRSDGSLALPPKAFDYLDYAIASVHSNFNLSREKMTERILRALSSPKVRILGHPTGRMLEEREGYELLWPQIFDFCRKNNKWLEICAWPNRLDLPDVLVREAVKGKVKMIINTDSHSLEHLDLMPYGVAVARRGWAEKNDIVNTLSLRNIRDKMICI